MRPKWCDGVIDEVVGLGGVGEVGGDEEDVVRGVDGVALERGVWRARMSSSRLRAARTRLAPARPKRSARARPRPREPPVMRTTWSVRGSGAERGAQGVGGGCGGGCGGEDSQGIVRALPRVDLHGDPILSAGVHERSIAEYCYDAKMRGNRSSDFPDEERKAARCKPWRRSERARART